MKIRILAVGKLKRGPLPTLIDDYIKRMHWSIQVTELDHGSKLLEGAQLMRHINSDDFVVLLDEKGESMSSQGFASFLEKQQVSGNSRICFIIGGAEGVHEDIYQSAHKRLAFGIQTWPHMMVRLMLVEQLYRAEQILAGHPYHKE